MANLRFWIPAIVVAATLLPAQSPAESRLSGAARPQDAAASKVARPAFVIGVVDLDRAIDRYGVAVRERERLQKKSEQFSEEINRITKGVDELRGQMSLLKPGSLDYEQTEFQLRLEMNRREGLASLRKKQFDRALEVFELAVYEDLEYAIARVAMDRGVAIVMRAQRTLDLTPQAGEKAADLEKAKLMQFNRRTVWYTSPEVDLTPQVIKYLQVFDPRAERLKAAAEAAAKSGAGKAVGRKPEEGK